MTWRNCGNGMMRAMEPAILVCVRNMDYADAMAALECHGSADVLFQYDRSDIQRALEDAMPEIRALLCARLRNPSKLAGNESRTEVPK